MEINPFILMPAVMDFLRHAALFSGRILFVEEDDEWAAASLNPNDNKHIVRECMLMCLASIY